jgi:hypothetical protein
MASTADEAARKAAAKAATTNRVFGPTQCHHRNAAGKPDCKLDVITSKTGRRAGNLCPKHEAIWKKAAAERYAAKKAATVTKVSGETTALTAIKARATRVPPNSGGQRRTVKPPVRAMGSGATPRVRRGAVVRLKADEPVLGIAALVAHDEDAAD